MVSLNCSDLAHSNKLTVTTPRSSPPPKKRNYFLALAQKNRFSTQRKISYTYHPPKQQFFQTKKPTIATWRTKTKKFTPKINSPPPPLPHPSQKKKNSKRKKVFFRALFKEPIFCLKENFL